jgi:hypothetical protein
MEDSVDILDNRKRYPSGPDDELLVNLTHRELCLVAWAYSVEVRNLKDEMGSIFLDMQHEAIMDHEDNILVVKKDRPGWKAGVRCFPITETTVMRIHSRCRERLN